MQYVKPVTEGAIGLVYTPADLDHDLPDALKKGPKFTWICTYIYIGFKSEKIYQIPAGSSNFRVVFGGHFLRRYLPDRSFCRLLTRSII
jgi:hypothetical protein